jgi:hypothetical protein
MLVASTFGLAHTARVHAAFNDSDGDGVIDVAERIAGSDPFSADSSPESAAGALYLGRPVCTDGIDNDGDGQTDSADPGCTDSDHDIVDDPSERVLGSDPNDFNSVPEDSRVDAVLVSLGFITFQCNDGLDNDLDGLIDDRDPGCAPFDTDGDGYGDVDEKTYGSDPNDATSGPEDDRVDPALCADGVDNDHDGLTDIDDSGCLAHPTATATPTSIEPTPTRGATRGPPAAATATPMAGLPATGSAGERPGHAIDGALLALGTLGVIVPLACAVRSRRAP